MTLSTTFTAHIPDALILALAAMFLNKVTSIAIRLWQGHKPVLIAVPTA